jgi:hypothetical protein
MYDFVFSSLIENRALHVLKNWELAKTLSKVRFIILLVDYYSLNFNPFLALWPFGPCNYFALI